MKEGEILKFGISIIKGLLTSNIWCTYTARFLAERFESYLKWILFRYESPFHDALQTFLDITFMC